MGWGYSLECSKLRRRKKKKGEAEWRSAMRNYGIRGTLAGELEEVLVRGSDCDSKSEVMAESQAKFGRKVQSPKCCRIT